MSIVSPITGIDWSYGGVESDRRWDEFCARKQREAEHQRKLSERKDDPSPLPRFRLFPLRVERLRHKA